VKDDPAFQPVVGDIVVLAHEEDCIVPAGEYEVSKVYPDGSFHVGGNTIVWPRRVVSRVHEHLAVTLSNRVIGFTYEYDLDPSQLDEGDPTTCERLIWGRVIDGGYGDWGEEIVFVENIHIEDEIWGVTPDAVHTIMPESY
jgi:hypothetical protein